MDDVTVKFAAAGLKVWNSLVRFKNKIAVKALEVIAKVPAKYADGEPNAPGPVRVVEPAKVNVEPVEQTSTKVAAMAPADAAHAPSETTQDTTAGTAAASAPVQDTSATQADVKSEPSNESSVLPKTTTDSPPEIPKSDASLEDA